MFGALSRIVSPAMELGRSLFGGNQGGLEVPITTNISTTNETAESGNAPYAPVMANPLGGIATQFAPTILRGLQRNLPAIGTGLGVGGGALAVFGGGSGELCPTPMSKPYNVNKDTGCITITRKQQNALKDALKYTDIPTLASSIGLDPMILCQLLLKRFKARGRGITPASMRTTKRTIRQIKTLHNEVASMAGRKTPVRRRSGAISQVNLRGVAHNGTKW